MPKVKFGLSNVHISLRTETEETVSYGTPVALKGAVSLTLTRANEKANFRADNMDYFSRFISTSREGTFECADIPDWFKTAYLGYKEAIDEYLVETNSVGASFALMFQVETDETNRKYIIYNCQAAETDEEHSTTGENDLSVQTSTLNLTMLGEVVGDYVCYSKEIANFETPELPVFPISA